MKPIYFPYTFVPEEIIQAGAACFNKIAVYMPGEIDVPGTMAATEKNGWLDIFASEKGNEEQVRSAVNDYKLWANAHADGDGIHLTLQGHSNAKAPFFNESSIMKIKEDIQKGIKGTNRPRNGLGPFLSSRVFLYMAHEFDMQHYDIHQTFRQLDHRENELLKNLQGADADRDDAIKEIYPGDTPFDFMIQERVEAWSGFMLHYMDPFEIFGLFVTGTRSVFSYIIENFSDGEMLFEIENIPIESGGTEEMQSWRDSLMRNIQRYAEVPWPVEIGEIVNPPIPQDGERKAMLRLYIVPGETPYSLFSRFYSNSQGDSHEGRKEEKIRNTFIGLLDVSL